MANPDQRQSEIESVLDNCIAETFRDFDAQTNLKELCLESFIKEIFFRHLKTKRRAWSTPQQCTYPNCREMTKISSHTIQRAGSIRFISEDGHVLTPQVNMSTGLLGMERVGINDASTFIGFCERHEKIFEFERRGTIETAYDFEAQIFRTICRELRLIQHYIIHFRDALVLYKKRATVELIIRAMDKLGKGFFEKYGISNVEWQFNVENQITELFRNTVVESEKRYSRLLKSFYEAYRQERNGKLTASELRTFLLTLPLEIPVALSGRTGFMAVENEESLSVDLILNVLPFPKKTLFFVTTTADRSQILEGFLNMYSSDIERLSLIESLMVYGTDHWFLKPSAWQMVPIHRRNILCDLVLRSDDNIATKCPVSIFDSARIKFIDDLKVIATETPHTSLVQSLIVVESAKLT